MDDQLDPDTLRAVTMAREKGASSWLQVLPLKEQGFCLNKGEFRDALMLRYNKSINDLPSNCPCGQKFLPDHAMSCKKGGFVHTRHDEIRDIQATLLKEICNVVEREPHLQPVTGEVFTRSTNTGDEARLDLKARGFWRRGQVAFFDIRITHPNAPTSKNQTVEQIYHRNEQEKKRQYNDRVMEIEQGTFTPLVYSTMGGMAPECERYTRHLSERIANKRGELYSKTIRYIRCRISFALLRSALLCLRGTRCVWDKNVKTIDDDFYLACHKAKL